MNGWDKQRIDTLAQRVQALEARIAELERIEAERVAAVRRVLARQREQESVWEDIVGALHANDCEQEEGA